MADEGESLARPLLAHANDGRDVEAGGGAPPRGRKHRVALALDGLECASCVASVEGVLKKQLTETDVVSVVLLPTARALVLATPHESERKPADTAKRLAEAVESAGFGAEVESANVVESAATVALSTQATAPGWRVARVRVQPYSLTRDARSAIQRGTVPGVVLHSSAPGNDDRTHAEEAEENDLTIAYDTRVFRGLRSVCEAVARHLPSTMAHVTPAPSDAQREYERAELKRAAELRLRLLEAVFALVFAIPTLVLSMGVDMTHTRLRDRMAHRISGFGVSYMELTLMLLATPVQFISGARFYRESWASLRRRPVRLGMSFLVALGSTAAYVYSVFVVAHNADRFNRHGHNDHHDADGGGEEHHSHSHDLMQTFETSATLIAFVLLGKFLEHAAKARTSAALAHLMKLTPASAALIVAAPPGGEHNFDAAPSSSSHSATPAVLSTRAIPVDLLEWGDDVLVWGGSRFPAAGFFVEGSTAV